MPRGLLRPVPALSLVATLAAIPGCIEVTAGDLAYVEREEKRFAVSGTPAVTLTTFDGSIEVRSWDRSEVLVVVEKRASTQSGGETIVVESSQDGNAVSVTARATPRAGLMWLGSRSAKLIVSLPPAANVNARSGDGSLDVEGVDGQLRLRSGDGSIRGRRLSGDVTAQTGDGSIRMEEVKGALEARSGDGSIVVGGTFSQVQLRTGDGSVVVHAAPGSGVQEGWDISSGDGSVTLELPDGFAAELDAHTGDGSISMDEISVSHVTGRIARNTVRGQLGTGGRPVRIRTGDGSIILRRR